MRDEEILELIQETIQDINNISSFGLKKDFIDELGKHKIEYIEEIKSGRIKAIYKVDGNPLIIYEDSNLLNIRKCILRSIFQIAAYGIKAK